MMGMWWLAGGRSIEQDGKSVSALDDKLQELKVIIKDLGSVLVAYSGGVDSTLLLKVAKDVLGDKVIAVTARSLTYPIRELNEAKELAGILGVQHIIIDSNELDIPEFSQNAPDRCYYCKSELFSKLHEIARSKGINYVLDGCNLDDLDDYRPGIKAAQKKGVRSPLKEAKINKEDVRKLSAQLGLLTWEKPSVACLASRFPYGDRITEEGLVMVAAAEDFLNSLGFRQLRVRHHGALARIEIPVQDIGKCLEDDVRTRIVKHLKEIGYNYITLDLQGYRTGSMNEVLVLPDRSKGDTEQ